MREFDGIIFDMDGVLCDSEPFICEAAQRMFREHYQLEMPEAAFVPFVGTGEDRYLGGPAEERGIVLDMPADKIRTYEIYLEIIVDRLGPLPGVHELVTAARAAGLRLAVASAADRMKVVGNLRAIGLAEDDLDALVTGSDVERKKPAPDGFLLAAERLGLDPARCLVVEDALNGAQAAGAAGCRCLGIRSSFDDEQLRAAGAEWTAPHLGELPEDLRRRLLGS